MSDLTNLSEYCAFIKGTGCDVTIVFAALNTEKGRFLGVRSFMHEEGHTIFVNCPDNQWYLNGIPGLGETWQAAAETLRNLCNELAGPEHQSTYYGGSMGGYGALLYGSRNRAGCIVATGVEFELCVPLGNAINHIKPSGENPIYEEINKHDSNIFVIYGGMSVADLYCASKALEKIKKATFNIYLIKGAGHSIPGILEKEFGLSKFIKALRCGCIPEFIGHPISSHDLRNVGQLYEIAKTSDSVDPAAVVHQLFEEETSVDLLTLACYYCGESLREKNDNDNAIRYYEKGIRLRNDNFMCHVGIAKSYQKSGNTDEAIHHLKLGIGLMDPKTLQSDFNAYILLSRLLLSKKAHAEARNLLNELLTYSPTNAKARELLESIQPAG